MKLIDAGKLKRWIAEESYLDDLDRAELIGEIESGHLDATAAAEGLLPMDKAPKDGSSILIYRKNKTDNQFCFVQASAYEGRFYADSRECLIDWEDGITSAIGWLPLPNTRAAGGGGQ